MYYGCHISIRGGYLGAAKTAHSIGINSYQYFPKNPRSLQLKKFDRRDAELCAQYCAQHDMLSIAHAPYPTNLAVAASEHRLVTLRSLYNDLEIAEACGSIGLVVHFGKWKGADALQGYRNVIETLNELLMQWDGNALILLENQSGESTMMGTTLEELVHIRSLAKKPEKIGFCLDSCHLFASGYWTGNNWSELEITGCNLNYFEHVKAVHFNDSKYPSGSLKDRHERIGKGRIGETGLRELANSPYLSNVPFILETPAESVHHHMKEIAWIKNNRNIP